MADQKQTKKPVMFREGTRKKGGMNCDPDPNYTPPKPKSFKKKSTT